eukprot:scaffold111964_cov22-Tisochrysis_lutea.AAC.2
MAPEERRVQQPKASHPVQLGLRQCSAHHLRKEGHSGNQCDVPQGERVCRVREVSTGVEGVRCEQVHEVLVW